MRKASVHFVVGVRVAGSETFGSYHWSVGLELDVPCGLVKCQPKAGPQLVVSEDTVRSILYEWSYYKYDKPHSRLMVRPSLPVTTTLPGVSLLSPPPTAADNQAVLDWVGQVPCPGSVSVHQSGGWPDHTGNCIKPAGRRGCPTWIGSTRSGLRASLFTSVCSL